MQFFPWPLAEYIKSSATFTSIATESTGFTKVATPMLKVTGHCRASKKYQMEPQSAPLVEFSA